MELPKLETISELPIVYIAGGSGPVISFLTENLSFQNLTVTREFQGKPSYIFDFNNDLSLREKAAEIGARYLWVKLEERPNVLMGDAVYELTKAMFGAQKQDMVTVGIPQAPKTEAALLPEQALLLQPSVKPQVQPMVVTVPIKRRSWRRPAFIIALAIIIFLFILPFVSIFVNGFFGVQAVKTAKEQSLKEDFAGAALSINSAGRSFEAAKKSLGNIAPILKIVYLGSFVNSFDQFLSVAIRGSDAGNHFLRAVDLLKPLILGSNAYIKNLPEAQRELTLSLENLGFIEAQKLKFDAPYLNYIPIVRQLLTVARDAALTIPELTAVNGKKTYLVLLQNNAELRPAGGFIGAYALVTFENGRFLNYELHDIYTADGQLLGKVTPPDEILHFLGQPNWFMRDSNFSPDFAMSARRAAWFLEKSTGQKTDGVIGIDMYVIQKLLRAVGPLDVTDFNEKITAENFFEKAEYQSEINFFPGSTKKQDFLTSVGQALIDKIISDKSNLDKMALALMEALNERHVQIYSQNEVLEEAIVAQGWGGTLNFEGDNYLGLTEANFGANKANYFVNREIFLQTDMAKTGDLDTTVTVIYENTSKNNAWPGGDYKNYLRLFIPPQAKFISANTGDNKKATVSAVLTENILKRLKPEEFLVYKSSDSGVINYGLLVNIPASSKKTVTFTYRLPPVDLTKEEIPHMVFIRKQAGTDNDKLTVIYNFPSFLRLTGVDNTTQFRYNGVLSQDKRINLVWKKQL